MALDWLNTAFEVGSTLLSNYGKKKQGADAAANGRSQEALARYQAAQLRVNALDADASAQISASDIDRQQQYVTSRALAVAASSGGGASDPTVINLIARTAGEGAYRRAVALYEGKSKAKALNAQADALEYGGSLAAERGSEEQSAANIGAFTTLVKSGASLYSKYGGDGPDSSGATLAPSSNKQSQITNELF